MPYTAADLVLARAWLTELGNGPVSQRDLAAAFERLAPPDPPRQQRGSAWIEGGPVAAPAELREEGTTIAVLRAEDAADRSADAVLRNAIPMPAQPVLKEPRALRMLPTRPPVTDNERLCIRCSLAPVCLPEEERLARDATWEPIRLFPTAPEGQVIHAVSRDAHVGRSGNTLVVKTEEGEQSFPVEQVRGVVLHGFSQMTTQALHLCGSRGIPVHWITGGGRYVGGLALGAGPVQRRIWQYEALRDPHLRLILARRLVTARIE